MAKQTINLGTSVNKGDGDPLRTAFTKINENFNELYALNGGASAELRELAQDYAADMFVDGTHSGITVVYDDINNKLNLTVPLWDNTTVSNNLIPDTDVAYDLGSATNRFRDLYLSGSTIDLGGTTISTVDGELQLDGVKIPTQTDLNNAVGVIPADVSDLTDTQGLLAHNDPTKLVNGSEEVTLEANGNLLLANGGRIIGGSVYLETISIIPNIEKDTQIGIISQDENEQVAIATSGGMWQFMGDGTMYIPGDIRGSDDLYVKSVTGDTSSGLFINGNPAVGSVVLYANSVATIRADSDGTAKDWTFDQSGTITTPLLFPKAFTAVLDTEHFNPQPGIALLGDPWEYQFEFQANPDGTIQVAVNDPVFQSNPGYVVGHGFRFTEADHGIPGYDFFVLIQDIGLEAGGYFTQIALGPVPEYPSTVTTTGAIKLTADTNSLVFGTNGLLEVPNLKANGVVAGIVGGIDDTPLNIETYATDGESTVINSWLFGIDGSLTFPDATVQTTAWTGSTSLSLNEIIVPDEQPFYIRTSEGTPLETALTISALGRIYLPSSTDYSRPVRSILTANDSLQINAGAVSYNLGSNGTVSLPGDALYYSPGSDFSIKTATTAADPSPVTWFVENEGTSDTPVFSISQATVGEGNVFLTWLDPTRPGTVQVKGPGILDGDTFVDVLTLDPYGDPYTATIGGENGVFTNGEFYTFQFTEQEVDSVRQWTFDTDGQLRLPSGVGNIMFADNTVQETASPYSVLAAAGYSVDIEDNVDLTGDGGNGADAFQTVVNFGPDEINIELFNINTVGVGTIGGSTGGSSVYTVVLSQGTSSVTLQGWAITPTDFATQQDPEGATFHYLGELIDITGDQYQFSQVILDTSFPAGTEIRLFNPNGTLYGLPEAGMTIRWADDTETAVIGVLIDGQYIYSSNPRVTFITAEDQSTLPFPITIRTNDFQDGSKTFTIDQDIGFSLVSIDNIANIESDTGLNVRVGLGSVIEFNVDDGAQDNVVRINEDGTVYISNGIVTDGDVAIGGIFRPQGAVIPSPVTVMPGSTVRVNDMQLEVTAIDGEGRVTAMTVLNSPNIEWASAGGTGALLGGDINISIPVDGSGNAVVTVNSSGTGHTVGEAYTIPAEQLGTVSGQVFAPIPLNSSQVQILSAEFGATGLYSLADGEEGQIMYFVPGISVTSTVYVLIDNARIYDGANVVNEVGYYWVPFHGGTEAPTTIAMAIFADGAWCLRGGVTD